MSVNHLFAPVKVGINPSFCSGVRVSLLSSSPPAVTVLPSSKKIAADDEYSQEFRGKQIETNTSKTTSLFTTVHQGISVSADKCIVKPDAGPCRAAFNMFYYDRDAGTCQSFIYGGCRGNNNRYSTMAECMDNCSQDGKDNPVAITLQSYWAA